MTGGEDEPVVRHPLGHPERGRRHDARALDPGDRIQLSMPYGRFDYRVERTRIVPPTATEVTDRVGYDRLILSACHPLYSAAKRIVVFARLERVTARGPASG